MGITYVDVICENCGKEFKKRKSEYKRSQKLGRCNFCSLSCSSKTHAKKPRKSRKKPVKEKLSAFVILTCDNCGKEFKRIRAEYNRSQELGRRNFCSLSCVGFQSWKHLNEYQEENTKRIIQYGFTSDEFSPFRRYITLMKRHNKQRPKSAKEISVTLQDLKNQWEKQEGICPYTGWKMYLSKSCSYGSEQKDNRYNPYRASVDRIDSAGGYTPDNIQFVCYIANIAKNQYQEDFLIEFCQAVAKHHESKKKVFLLNCS